MRRLSKLSEGHYMFECPGCECSHQIFTEMFDGGKPKWKFNGDLDAPSFTPSLLVQWEQGEEQVKNRCHSFIVNGQIRFLNDCTHGLAGQTVDLPPADA